MSIEQLDLLLCDTYQMRSLGLDCDFNGLSETDEYWADIEEKVGNFLTLKCLDEHYNPDSNGIICESILNKIPV